MRLAVPLALATVAAGLAAGSLYEIFAPLDPVETAEFHPKAAPLHLAAPPAPPPADAFADIDARPLFSMTRQPLPDTALPGGGASTGSDFILVGVISGGEKSVALLRSRSTQQSTSAAVGDIVNGWRIAKIDPTSVTLRSATGSIVIGMEAPGSQPPTAPIAPLQPIQQPTPVPQPVAPPVAPATAAAAPAAGPAAKPAMPSGPTPPKPKIAPEALRGAPIDPSTGEPTL